MNDPEWVLESVVLRVQASLLGQHGGSDGLRDRLLLQSALVRPLQKLNYEPTSSIFDLASAYSFGIVKNHPFVDGNKRIGFTVGAYFLYDNGYDLHATEAEAAVVFKDLASGELTEEELSAWFESNCVPK